MENEKHNGKNNIKNGNKMTIYQAAAGSVGGFGILIFTLLSSMETKIDKMENDIIEKMFEADRKASVREVKFEDYNKALDNKLDQILDELKYHIRRKTHR